MNFKIEFQTYAIIIFFLNFYLLVNTCSFYKRESKINLLNNGYENILITIDNSINENKELIDRIKFEITHASALLFNATNNRAYFREIIILIPRSWSLKEFEKDYLISETTWESIDKSDICISPRENSNGKRALIGPFVYNYASDCGQSGMHIHMTPEYFFNSKRALSSFGSYDTNIIHEWSHFRYGVFNEYPNRHEDGDYYFNENGEIDAIRCGKQITGKLRDAISPKGECKRITQNGLPHHRCIFEDDFTSVISNYTSLMYKPLIPQLNAFCDEINHNKLAPNAQNRECKGKSVWEVLNEHHDFNHDKNLPIYPETSTKPIFRIVKQKNRRFMLLIDNTIGYQAPERQLKLKRSLEDLINVMLRDGDKIGIIHFSSFSKVTLGLTQIRNKNDRKFILENALPRGFSNRQANFWSALSLGIISLRNSPDEELPDGASFILITDAIELENYPKKDKIFEQLKAYDITVDTISFSFNADHHLEILSQKTNGLSYRLSDNLGTFYLQHALKEIFNRDLPQSLRSSTIFSNYLSVESENILFLNVYIDETVATRKAGFIQFQFQVDFGQSMPSIEIKEPKTHRIYSTYQNEFCKQLQDSIGDMPYNYIICNIENPQNGLWDIRILNNFFENLNVRTVISSFISNNNELSENNLHSLSSNQINIEAIWKYNIVHYPQMQVLYVMISREHRPILDANVEAIIYKPNGEQIKLDLFDNGLHADRYKNDGVYSRFFLDYSINGPYCALVFVKSKNSTVIHSYKIANLYESGNLNPSKKIYSLIDENAIEKIDEFERVLLSTSFLVQDLELNEGDDRIPPSKIKDFKLKRAFHILGEVQFEFTAPGDDGDFGVADLYEIIIGTNPMKVLDAHEFTLNSTDFIVLQLISSTFSRNLTPNLNGSKENFMIKIPQENMQKVIAIKIRAIDEYGNKGDWSDMSVFNLNRDNIQLAKGIDLYNSNEDYESIGLHKQEEAIKIQVKRNNRIKITLIIIFILLVIKFAILILIKLLKQKFWPKQKVNESPKTIIRV